MATEKNNLEEGIVNLVDKSGLVQIELDTIASIKCLELDFTDWLWRGVVVREKEFRASIKALDTEVYQGVGVAISCSKDALVPDWAWMLISSKLNNAAFVVIGRITAARAEATRLAIVNLNIDDYIDACGYSAIAGEIAEKRKSIKSSTLGVSNDKKSTKANN